MRLCIYFCVTKHEMMSTYMTYETHTGSLRKDFSCDSKNIFYMTTALTEP